MSILKNLHLGSMSLSLSLFFIDLSIDLPIDLTYFILFVAVDAVSS